jgi:hypothetical protein
MVSKLRFVKIIFFVKLTQRNLLHLSITPFLFNGKTR